MLEEIIGGKLNWKRLALTQTQADRYELTPITKRDKRFKGDGGVHQAIETEALSQRLIIDIVRDWLDPLLPEPLDHVHVREERERDRLRRLITQA